MTTTRNVPLYRDAYFLLFVITVFYVSYRYPMQVNEEMPGSGYADTPVWLQTGKYVLVLMVLGFTGLMRLMTRGTNTVVDRMYFLLFYVFLFGSAVLTAVVAGSLILLKIAPFLLIPIAFHLLDLAPLNVNRMTKFLRFVVWTVIAVDIVQVMLYYTIGRLPAVSHEGSVSIRFGSLWDDPNGFGLFLSFLIPFAWFSFEGIQKKIAVSLLALMLPITQSLTGITATVLTVTLLFAIKLIHRPNVRGILLATAGAIVVVVVLLYGADLLHGTKLLQAWQIKEKSMAVHLADFSRLGNLRMISLLGIDPTGTVCETNYVDILENYGIFYLMASVGLKLYATIHFGRLLFGKQTSKELRAFSAGAFCYLSGYLLGSFFLPSERAFPVNILGILLTTVATMDRYYLSVAVPGVVSERFVPALLRRPSMQPISGQTST